MVDVVGVRLCLENFFHLLPFSYPFSFLQTKSDKWKTAFLTESTHCCWNSPKKNFNLFITRLICH